MVSRDPERRYQRDKVDQLELTQQPLGGIVLPAVVPPSLSAMRPKPSDDPAVQLVEALSNLGAAVVVAPASDDRVDRFNQLAHAQRCSPLRLSHSIAARYFSSNPSDSGSLRTPCPPASKPAGRRGITPAFGYSAPHPSAGGTLTLLIHALPSAHYGAVRPSPAHRYFRPRGWSRLRLFPWHRRSGSHVPYKSLVELRAVYMPDAARAVSGHPPS